MCNLGFLFYCASSVHHCLFACDQWVLYFHSSLAHRLYEYVLRWVGSGWAFSEHVYERERREEEEKKEKGKNPAPTVARPPAPFVSPNTQVEFQRTCTKLHGRILSNNFSAARLHSHAPYLREWNFTSTAATVLPGRQQVALSALC